MLKFEIVQIYYSKAVIILKSVNNNDIGWFVTYSVTYSIIIRSNKFFCLILKVKFYSDPGMVLGYFCVFFCTELLDAIGVV